MLKKTSRHLLPLAICVTPLGCLLSESAGSDEEVTQVGQYATANDPDLRGESWVDYGDTIPVCFRNSGYSTEKAIIQEAVERSWGEKTDLHFVWHDVCPNTSSRFLVIRFDEESGKSSCKKSPSGMRPADGPESSCRFKTQSFTAQSLYQLAAHEIGHMIGLDHEFHNPDTAPVTALTPTCTYVPPSQPGALNPTEFDPWSLMSIGSCRPATHGGDPKTPSGLDLFGVQMLYGSSMEWGMPGRNFCRAWDERLVHGDWNGDGLDDLLCIQETSGNFWYDYASADGEFTGSDFVDYGRSWCVAANQTLFVGDFDGDGRDDLFCEQTDGRMFVELANANGQFVATNWSAYRHFCHTDSEHELFIGDFNGDGRDDLLCNSLVNGDMRIRLAQLGGTFGTTNNWTSYIRNFCVSSGDRLVVGDFNGDSRDDIACTRANGSLMIDHAAVNAFFSSTNWSGQRDLCASSSDELLVADFNGDGRDDLMCRSSADQHFTLELADENNGLFDDYDVHGNPQPDGVGTLGEWCASGTVIAGRFNDVSRVSGRPSTNTRADLLCNDETTGTMSIQFDLMAPKVANRNMYIPGGSATYIGPIDVPAVEAPYLPWSAATIFMAGYTGNVDLYARRGAWPTTTAYDCADILTSSFGKCSLGGSGPLYILLHNASSTAATDLDVDVFTESLGAVTP